MIPSAERQTKKSSRRKICIVQNVFVNAGYKDIFDWQGKPVLAEANRLAREVNNRRVRNYIYELRREAKQRRNTGALGSLVNLTYIGKSLVGRIDINSGLSEEELWKI